MTIKKPDRRIRDLWRRYKITFKQYLQLLINQDYSCAICGRGEWLFNRALDVDHCHNTGRIRGLLCRDCNKGLGMFRDNAHHIDKAAKYLKKSA